jgi:hypothetical protein
MTVTDSRRRCPRCSKRLRLATTQAGVAGTPATELVCDNCPYRERGVTGDVPWQQLPQAERLRLIRQMRDELYGPRPERVIEHEIVYDTDPFPVDELDEAVELAESEPVGHLEPAELAGA